MDAASLWFSFAQTVVVCGSQWGVCCLTKSMFLTLTANYSQHCYSCKLSGCVNSSGSCRTCRSAAISRFKSTAENNVSAFIFSKKWFMFVMCFSCILRFGGKGTRIPHGGGMGLKVCIVNEFKGSIRSSMASKSNISLPSTICGIESAFTDFLPFRFRWVKVVTSTTKT